MTAKVVLEAARGLLRVPGVWIKGHVATNKAGAPVGYWDPRASRFSVTGAILRAAYITNTPAANAYKLLADRICPGKRKYLPPEHWNDAEGTNLQAVLTVFNDLIVSLGGDSVPLYEDLDDENT